MTQTIRQSELFAGNDWTAIYKAFTNINLNAFDFTTIRDSMVTYIRMNYPEQYNDWVVQSEFVALLDVVAYLGQSLAFRMDISARENFIDIARKRESILRLAQFLSYNPRRNIPASGLLKLTGVSTTENVIDSNGTDINNTKIVWSDPSNDFWYDQFISVMNASFISTNPFGIYLDQQDINSVTSQLYRIDSLYNNAGQYSFTSTVNNTSTSFEVVNMEMSDSLGYVEVEPNPITKFQLCYLNDGNGFTSNRTGFFSLFKQGTMGYTDFTISSSIANNSITVDVNNINDSDVWVQTVNDNGYLTTDGSWTKVGYVPSDDITKIISNGENITYNSSLTTTQNIYQAMTLSDDRVMIKFGDGNFGTIPSGNIRVWYRASNGLSYYIRPDEIKEIPIKINYYDSMGKSQTLTLYYSLFDTVVNASTTQSDDDIRRITGNMYSTQGRMVSGSDYNFLPASVGSGLKVKATNRFYSGQSRFIDINDPTGQYQNTVTFSDDGALYSEYSLGFESITSTTYTASQIVYKYVIQIFEVEALKNFMINEWVGNSSYPFTFSTDTLKWKRSTKTNYISTGLFTDLNGDTMPVGSTVTTVSPEKYISVGSLLKFKDSSNNIIWASVEKINEDGTEFYTNSNEGPIRLNAIIPDGAILVEVVPNFNSELSTSDVNNIEGYINNKLTFGIGYDYTSDSLYYIDNKNINFDGDYDYTTKGSTSDSSWIAKFEYTPVGWYVYYRQLDYVFESDYEVKFFFVNGTSVMNPHTGYSETDTISVLKYNSNTLTSDVLYNIENNYTYPDGYQEPKRVYLTYWKTTSDGSIANPDTFNTIINLNSQTNYVFHKKTTDASGYEVWDLTDDVVVAPATGNVVYTPGTTINNGVFTTSDSSTYDISNYKVNYGVKGLSFKWKHVADISQRIDPAISNIIDIFVLTSGYYDEMLSWREDGYSLTSIPTSPTEVELELEFSSVEDYKMFSDEIIWRPAQFKLIGGSTASSELQFDVLIVPLPGTTYSDGEIKADVLNAINTYFDVSSWDFGEIFYASELIGYLHQQLLNSISSVVIVPNGTDQSFGNLFQIKSGADELFFPTLTIDNIKIVSALTNTNLRIQ